jgi:hypothetical protein
MHIRISLLFFLTIIILILLHFRHKGERLTFFEFFLCATWGFLIAHSHFAENFRHVIDAFAHAFDS